MGRKSNYEVLVKPKLAEIAKWCLTMNEEQICKCLNVSVSAFGNYKNKYPELAEALKSGRSDLVEQCRSNLIKRANGYEYTERKTITSFIKLPDEIKEALEDAGWDKAMIAEMGKPELVRIEETIKHEKPDVAANNALLKVHDENWHEADKNTLNMRREELDIKKKKAEADAW